MKWGQTHSLLYNLIFQSTRIKFEVLQQQTKQANQLPSSSILTVCQLAD